MTEEELEDGVTPEVLEPSIQLMQITRESNLDPDLANEFRINFEEHFKMANEWSKKAKAIIVTNENQTVLMEQARVARLFIRSKRLEIENFRKSKKEYYLRGGQAVDKVCGFLKNMIEPIESHLDLQEHYVEYKKKAEDARLLAEAQAKQQEEEQKRISQEAEEREKLRIENEKLRKAAEIKEEIDRKFREEAENKLQEERNKALRAERELQLRKQEEMKKEADRIRAEEELLNAGDAEKLQAFRLSVLAIKIPEVKSAINKRIIEDAKSHLFLAISKIKITEEE
jgi:hypothetical protein